MRRFGGLLSFFIAAVWAYRWEALRALLYEQGFQAMSSLGIDQLLHWGVPLAFAGVGLFLFLRTDETLGNLSQQLICRFPFMRLPLYEAAVRAYDGVKNAPYGIAVYGLADTADARLVWLCDAMLRYVDGKEPMVKLYGNEPPGTKIEEIYMQPLNSYSFEVEDHSIILKANYGSSRYENLSVYRGELKAAIRDLASRKL